jgi:hypothetical protein
MIDKKNDEDIEDKQTVKSFIVNNRRMIMFFTFWILIALVFSVGFILGTTSACNNSGMRIAKLGFFKYACFDEIGWTNYQNSLVQDTFIGVGDINVTVEGLS